MTLTNLAVVGNNWFPKKPGGLDRYVYELVHTLAIAHPPADQTKIDLYGVGLPNQRSMSNIQLHNLGCPEASLWRRLAGAYQTFTPLGSSQYSAINIHFALYGLAALPHLPKDVPVTCTFHGPWAIESQQEGGSRLSVWLKQQMEKQVYRRCDRFIVLSKAFGQILHQEYAVPWDRIHIIPGGVDIERFQPSLSRQEARHHLGWSQDRFILFTPRRLVNRMGLSQLLEAIAHLSSQPASTSSSTGDLWLAVAGKGPLRETLDRQTTDLNLMEHVKFLGFLPDDDLPIAYQAADLTVMPSQSLEGFGLVLLESLASGTPALCTPVGGMPEVIHPFSPNLMTTSPTAEAIASTLSAILSGTIPLPDRAICRDYAVTQFNWSTIAQQVKDVLLR
ncbi:MAG: glycosyltransferase family 4 protein [Leptolyngbyaceae cyanobacterium]